MQKDICLHNYQLDITRRIAEAWHTHRSVMVQMPTGTGKTHVLASVVKEFLLCDTVMVWIVAHRRELVEQIEETVARFGIKTDGGCVRVMSIQWLALHIGEMAERPRLVIIDEAHHAQARTYRQLWDECPEARFLGLTATPCRMNRSGFTDLFDVLITSWSIAEFIEKGQLSAFDYVSIRPDCREQQLIDSLEKRGADGDYLVKEMNDRLNCRQSIGRLYDSVRKFADNKKGIVYAISIDHARRIADYYSRHGLAAVSIDSRTPVAERKRLVADFKSGRVKVLVNVDVFSEGFDCPDVEFVQMARPTLSLAKYLQQVGRGLRRSADKEACTLIDNVGLYRVFGLPTVSWDWEAMFRGEQSGKGTRKAVKRNLKRHYVAMSDEQVMLCSDMEMVMSHDNLLFELGRQHILLQRTCQQKLEFWHDDITGLWGLVVDNKKTAGRFFVSVFDSRYGMAAVRYADSKECALIDASGTQILMLGACKTMKFSNDYFLTIYQDNGKYGYVDLYSLRMYDVRPKVRRFGGIELLKVGNAYYSRTKRVYANNQNIDDNSISYRVFFIAVFDYKKPAALCLSADTRDGYECGYACLIEDDCDSYYWICRWLDDGSIVVADDNGLFYHVQSGKTKLFIGCCNTVADRLKCSKAVEAIVADIEQKKTCHSPLLLHGNRMACAVPFKTGLKWGLKIGDAVVVPPIYRNIKSPVGKYCAVERNYNQWGVIALDGKVVIEPAFSDIEISSHGLVIGTKVTGATVSLQLP